MDNLKYSVGIGMDVPKIVYDCVNKYDINDSMIKYYLYIVSVRGLDDDMIEWLAEKGGKSLLTGVGRYINQTKRFKYWFNDVIRYLDKASSAALVLLISNADCVTILDDNKEYVPGKFSNLLIKFIREGNVDYNNIAKLHDLCRLATNVMCNTSYVTFKSFTWIYHIADFERFRYIREYATINNRELKQDYVTLFRGIIYTDAIDRLVSHKVSLDRFNDDINFMLKYIDYIDCDEEARDNIKELVDIFINIRDKYYCYLNNGDYEIHKLASGANERVIQYVDSNTSMLPSKYWINFNPDNLYTEDIKLVKEYYPDTYQIYVDTVNQIRTNKFTKRLHSLISLSNKLTDKFGDLYNMSLLDYVSNGGNPNISDTLNFIANTDFNMIQELKKIIGPLNKLNKYTRQYIKYDKEMSTVHIVKDHELTTDEKKKLFEYMDRNKYPRYLVLFNQVAKAYVEGKIEI